MTHMSQLQPATYEPATQSQQMAFIQAMLDGALPMGAARKAGSDLLSLYLARCSDPEFDQWWHLAELAKRDEALHATLHKAMAASGTVVMDYVLDDTGQPYLDENFEPIRAPKLVGANTAILSKLLERLMASADKPAPSAVVQINNSNQLDNGALQPMPRLINPSEEEDHD